MNLLSYGEFPDIVRIKRGETIGDLAIKRGRGKEVAKSLGSRRKAARDANPRVRQLTDHLTQRSVLTPYRVDIRHAELLERNHIRHSGHL